MSDPARRLSIYISEADRYNGKPLFQVVLELLKNEGCAGATMFRGVAGFGGHQRIHTANLADITPDLPVLIDVVDSAAIIDKVLPRLEAIVQDGMITLSEVEVIKYSYRRLSGLELNPGQAVSDAMTPLLDVVSVQPNTPLYQMVQLLLGRSFKALPVVDKLGKVVGIVTDGDLFGRGEVPLRLDHLQALTNDSTALEQQVSKLKTSPLTAAQVMSQPVSTLRPQMLLLAAARQMNEQHLKRVPVVDNEGRLVGMLSRFDLLRAALGRPKSLARPGSQIAPILPIPASNLQMPVDKLMETDFPRVNENATLPQILTQLTTSRQHRALVVGIDGRTRGMLTESDMIKRVGKESRPSLLEGLRRKLGRPGQSESTNFDPDLKASTLISGRLIALRSGASLEDAIHLMAQEGVKLLPVLDQAGRPIGVVSRRDIFQALLRSANPPDQILES